MNVHLKVTSFIREADKEDLLLGGVRVRVAVRREQLGCPA